MRVNFVEQGIQFENPGVTVGGGQQIDPKTGVTHDKIRRQLRSHNKVFGNTDMKLSRRVPFEYRYDLPQQEER